MKPWNRDYNLTIKVFISESRHLPAAVRTQPVRCEHRFDVWGYLRVQVADVDGPPDLINFWGIHISHEGRLRHRRCGVHTSWHPIHYGKVQLHGWNETKRSETDKQRGQKNKKDADSHSEAGLGLELVAAPHQESDWVLGWRVPKETRPWPPLGFSLQDRSGY